MSVDLSPGTTVQATNKGNTPFSIQWNGKFHKLEPSKPAYIPAEAAVLWFGDPRSGASTSSFRTEGGDVIVIPDRDSEVRRLCVKYGYTVGGEVEFLSKQGEHKDNKVPNVELRALDKDILLPTVLSDPQGEQVTPVITTVAEQSDLLLLIKAQQAQIAALQQHIGFSPSVVETNEGQEIPEDDSVMGGESEYSDHSPLDLLKR